MRRFAIVLLVGCSMAVAGTGCGRSANASPYGDIGWLLKVISPRSFPQGIWYIPRLPVMEVADFIRAQAEFLEHHANLRLIAVLPYLVEGKLVGVWFYTEEREKK